MDLIYTDENRVELGVLSNFSIDFEENKSTGNNTFEIKQSLKSSALKLGYFFFMDGTEYGGRIESIKCDTASKSVYAKGRSWRGMLEGKIIVPDPGQAYFAVSGDANQIIAAVLQRVDYSDLFVAQSTPSGIDVGMFKFDRYTNVYAGLLKMLTKNGAKMKLEWKNGKVVVSAVPIVDFSNTTEINSDMFDFVIEKKSTVVNHMIGLGQGELADRTVVHEYLDIDGNISTEQTIFGVDEVVAVYDNSSCESEEELIEQTIEKLKAQSVADMLSINSKGNLQADIGDRFQAVDMDLGISVTQFVITKIIGITDETIKIQYKVGELL